MQKNNSKLLLQLIFIIIGMFALAYASFPLYRIFCKVTGYGGTTQVASQANTLKQSEKIIKIRFNADVSPELNWHFEPVQKTMEVHIGENKMAYYTAENLSSEVLTGVATYNVTPNKAGIYFNKVQCFCFNEQTLQPGEKVEMPITFYVDPAIEDDRALDDVSEITLSYTFFKSKN